MGAFADQVKRAVDAKIAQSRAVVSRVGDLAFHEIVYGGPISGAPGQPVAAPIFEKAGVLRDSWNRTQKTPDLITIWTVLRYADDVEDNLKGVRFRTGGPHSVKLVVLAGPRYVAQAVQEIMGGGG